MKNIPTMIDNVTELPADDFNEFANESENVILSTGQALTSADLNQVGVAMAEYAARGEMFIDASVTDDTFTLNAQGIMRSPYVISNGMQGRFFASNSSTGGACTIQWPGLASTTLLSTDGTVPGAGDILPGDLIYAFYMAPEYRLINLTQLGAITHALGALAYLDQVDTAQIVDNSVTTGKILAGAITTNRLADNSVTQDKMVNNSVGVAELQANSVGASEIISGAVGSPELAANAVTSAKILNATIDLDDINNEFKEFQSWQSLGQLVPVVGTTSYVNSTIFSNAGGSQRFFRLFFDVRYTDSLGDDALKIQFYRNGVLQSGAQYWYNSRFGNAGFSALNSTTEIRLVNTVSDAGNRIVAVRGFLDIIGPTTTPRVATSGQGVASNDTDNGGEILDFAGGMNDDVANDLTGFRMFMTGGATFSSGSIIRPYQIEVR